MIDIRLMLFFDTDLNKKGNEVLALWCLKEITSHNISFAT